MVKVVIGCGENKNVLLAVNALKKDKNITITVVDSDNELISAFKDDSVDAIVRGSLKSSNLLKNINDLVNNSNNRDDKKFMNRMSFINFNINSDNANNINNSNNNALNTLNINKIENNAFNGFLLGPVGIDEGKTMDEKFELIIQGCQFMLDIGKIPKIAVLAGGRKEDFGRSPNIDKSIEDSEKLVQMINESFLNYEYGGYSKNIENNLELNKKLMNNMLISDKISVKNYYILIEKAIMEKNNIIIAHDGIIGNIIFRTLVLSSSWKSNGAIALGSEKIFIDTSRDQSKKGYMRSLNFAHDLFVKKIHN